MILSKTNFITFLDCNKNAWLKIHKPEVYYAFPLSQFEQNIIDTGNEIDLLARGLFPGGITVSSRDDFDYTQKLIQENTPIIYQPVFSTDKYLTALDIIVFNPNNNNYDLFEVKASTSSEENGGRKTDDYIIDVAFQKNVLNELKIPIGRINLVRLNKEYVRSGDINIQELFIIEDVTNLVEPILDQIKAKMDGAYHYLSNETEPAGHCDCIIKGKNSHCTTSKYSNHDLPEYPVHSIARIHKTKLTELVDGNILNIMDVPPDFPLSENQRRQVDTAQSDKVFIDKDGVNQFLDTLEYPISFLDYETYPSALPKYNGFKPYQQIPFQFSLHIIDSKGADVKHCDFIYTETDCPDLPFAEALKNNLPSTGCILVWNKKFEKGINDQIGERLPDYIEFMKALNSRVIDLMDPFAGKTLVFDHPKFKGSASIKYVLPALVPHLSYKNMDIQEGGTASDTWNRIVSGEYSKNEKECKIKALKEYCHLDTLAMVEIWKVLMSI